MNLTTLYTAIVLFAGTLAARSQNMLSWSFDATQFTVQPTKQILLTATVANLSDVPFTISGGGANFSGDLQKSYDFMWLLDVFDKTVPGGGTLQFTFGALTPIGGSVTLGTYHADPAQINFAGINDFQNLLPSQNTFVITVIPEPTAVSLFGLAGAAGICFSWLRSRRYP
jgi:hypothetical protein